MSTKTHSQQSAESVSLALEYLDKLTTNELPNRQRPAAIRHIRKVLQAQLTELNNLTEPA